jgi:hypothetical protein
VHTADDQDLILENATIVIRDGVIESINPTILPRILSKFMMAKTV